ncbi:MAG: putative transporter ATP-binding protein [Planctomycetota bacterium]|nr:putative transporter ATP-binding protein [Planctomycetota bacterium]
MSLNPTRRLLILVAPHRGRLLLGILLAAMASALNVPVPLLIREVVDRSSSLDTRWALAGLGVGAFSVFLAQAAVSLATARVVGPVGLAVVRDLRHALYARLQGLGLAYFDRTPTGVILSRMTDDVDVIQSLVSGQSIAILTDLGTTAIIAVVMVHMNARLALVLTLVLLAYAVTFRFFTRRIRAGSVEIRDRLDRIFGHLKGRIDGMLVVKACAREDAEIAEFAGWIGAAHAPRVRLGRLGAAFSNLSVALGGIGSALVFAVGAIEVMNGRMTPGGAVSAAALAGLLFAPVARLADLASVFEQAAASTDRLGEILDMKPDVLEPVNPVPFGRASGLVEFDRVGFGYNAGQPVVWDVRLRIKPGMHVAIVGPTGCGKSTLMNLLLRFYDPTWGEVRLDGVPLSRIATADLRRQAGVVLQEPVVFAGTLADNIRYGAPDANDVRVEAAARAALIHDLAISLPAGYATVIGEGGRRLSQGERQRVAIARAFCANPTIVVLDEATSALDTATEALIQVALRNLLKGRTAFIIAHRLATVVDADLIVVMDGGLVVQTGTHDELLASDGLYRALCARQFGDRGSHAPRREGERISSRVACPLPRLLDVSEVA